MKKSIFFASLILIVTIGWLASGQLGKFKLKEGKKLSNSDDSYNINKDDQATNNINKIKVETKISTSKKIDQSILIQGQTIYNKKVDIKSEITGNITKLNFKRGDSVKQSALLFEISKENRKELLKSAKELIKLYEIEYSSTKKLIEKGLSSKSKLALAAYNLADAKSKLKDIQLDIDNTNIIAPFDGIIVEKNLEISDFVIPGNILATIVSLDPIKIQGFLSEFDINKIKKDTRAILENSNGVIKEGKITFISPTADRSTRTFEITVEANNDDLSFKSGITTSIIIEGSELQAHKIPPSILTLQDDGVVGVKALSKDNIVIFYPITKVKDTVNGMWVSGLPDEVNLIISGQEYVIIGQSIDLD